MEFKKKTIIWENNSEPPKNYIWVKGDKVLEWTEQNGWSESTLLMPYSMQNNNTIQTIPQTLTEEQKAIARTNLGLENYQENPTIVSIDNWDFDWQTAKFTQDFYNAIKTIPDGSVGYDNFNYVLNWEDVYYTVTNKYTSDEFYGIELHQKNVNYYTVLDVIRLEFDTTNDTLQQINLNDETMPVGWILKNCIVCFDILINSSTVQSAYVTLMAGASCYGDPLYSALAYYAIINRTPVSFIGQINQYSYSGLQQFDFNSDLFGGGWEGTYLGAVTVEETANNVRVNAGGVG